MTLSIGRPDPDCATRAGAAADRRKALEVHATEHGAGTTSANGEETRFGPGYPLNFHKALPHDVNGFVHDASYHAMVAAVTGHHEGALETLPVGANRTGAGTTPTDPQRMTVDAPEGFRKLTSPLTGHVFDVEGGDAAAFGIAPAPRLDSEELAAELAEVYAMALVRDVPFTDFTSANPSEVVDDVTSWLQEFAWLDGSHETVDPAEDRRFRTRHPVGGAADLFRGSTPGSTTGHWLSQFMLIGNDNTHFDFRREDNSPTSQQSGAPSYRGIKANAGREDGYILYGAQVIDQRSFVAKEGIDHLTDWASWLDCQNGVDFNGADVFRDRRRYLTTPRDIATYVHYDALYQAYLNACLLMLADGATFPKDPGLPETSSRTRAAFASFGGPHVLSLVTEVATRALKAVWRQKWMHHRRTRPEVVAALLTLYANEPADPADHRITDGALRDQLDGLLQRMPAGLLTAVAAHNTTQNASDHAREAVANLPAGFPDIDDDTNYLLPMAFPEGSPTHPAYGAGHATVAGACVTVLKAMFDMFDARADDGLRPWTYDPLVAEQKESEGGELVVDPNAPTLTVQGELDKLAANISIARNMAGVHYYTDYYESARLGERIATSIVAEQLGMYREPVSVRFTSFDGEHVAVRSDGDIASVAVTADDGTSVPTAEWYGRYAS